MLLRRDVDYIVRDDHIALMDELTGRVVQDRRWPDGLQASLEAKEGVEQLPEGRSSGRSRSSCSSRISRLCGMTGTPLPAALNPEVYGLDVLTCRPTGRSSASIIPTWFSTPRTKQRAILAEVARVHAAGRPVLVGTGGVEESGGLAAVLARPGSPAGAQRQERRRGGWVVAGAGEPGAVTISTNMAGRGTDIRLGG